MKIAIVLVVALVAFVYADPIGISDNKIGDIITADVDFNIVISSNVDQNIMNVLAALMNQQAAVVTSGDGQLASDHSADSHQPAMDLTSLLTPENIEKAKSMLEKLGKKQE